jgi:DNA-binding winged helix-turn-helix (wHTH) protein
MQRFGAFVFNADTRQLICDGADVHLTPKAFDLLAMLLNEAPRVVTKTELHQRLWPKSFVSDAALVGLVKELRRALDDSDPEAPIIRTVPRVGYAIGRPVSSGAPLRGVCSWILVAGERLPLREGENTIGRDPLSSVWLDVASVSRRHARIVCNGAHAVIEDLGSKNGTTVGQQTVTTARDLNNGDRITFGRVDAIYFASAPGMPTVTRG